MPGWTREGGYLRNRLDQSSRANPEDVIITKDILKDLGFYDPPTWGISPFPDAGLFQGIKEFQKDYKLRVDGVMVPGGETESHLTRSKRPFNSRKGYIALSPKQPYGRPRLWKDEKVTWQDQSSRAFLNVGPKTYNFQTQGPFKVVATSPMFGVDGIGYRVGWHPLDAQGERVDRNSTGFPASDREIKQEHGGPMLNFLFWRRPNKREFFPPFSSLHGYDVDLTVSHRPPSNGASLGKDLLIHFAKEKPGPRATLLKK